MIGSHLLAHWARTQVGVALSSGEAELTTVVKCSCETLGILQLAADWALELEGEVMVDSSAALGVVARRGAGKLRHVRVGQLWVQEKQETGELRYRKVKGTENPADLATKPLTLDSAQRYMNMIGQECREGRAERSLRVAT